ncbi:hypothetical protein CRE_09510 [Caenorhabditis remanei]|uniref:Uncharacterized protein n=1 Tax=Caenorhabditis remanei TaxID=31234 RepID=E3MIZ6_CAERE|nr:hypothetical protein CRE_09510 [Caenorhabditis remanei]
MHRSNRLLSYQSSKCVLQYLPAALRFEFSNRCPAIRSTDNSTPLRIRNFRISFLSLSVDNVRYKVGVIRQYHNGNTKQCDKENSGGGAKHDIDEYGLLANTEPFEQCPDEIIFSNCEVVTNLQEMHEFNERTGRNTLAELANETNPDFEKIQEMEEVLTLHQLKRERSVPPFSRFIQLQISVRHTVKHVERVEYKQSVYNAMKYLVWKFLARRQTILTQHFGFNCQDIVRLPRELRVITKNLHFKTWNTNVLHQLQPFLVADSFPLDSFKTNGWGINFNDSIIQNSKLLLLRNTLALDLRSVKHSNVRDLDNARSENGVLALLRHWLENVPSVGTSFSLNTVSDILAEDLFRGIESIPGATIREIASRRRLHFPLQALIRLNDYSEVKVYCKSRKDNRMIQTINMKVQEIRRPV